MPFYGLLVAVVALCCIAASYGMLRLLASYYAYSSSYSEYSNLIMTETFATMVESTQPRTAQAYADWAAQMRTLAAADNVNLSINGTAVEVSTYTTPRVYAFIVLNRRT